MGVVAIGLVSMSFFSMHLLRHPMYVVQVFNQFTKNCFACSWQNANSWVGLMSTYGDAICYYWTIRGVACIFYQNTPHFCSYTLHFDLSLLLKI